MIIVKVINYIVLFFGVVFTCLGLTADNAAFKPYGVALFLAGVIFGLFRMERDLLELKRTNESQSSVGLILLQLNKFAKSSYPIYIQQLSRILCENVFSNLLVNMGTVVKHATDHTPIRISNHSPVYSIMHEIVREMRNGSVYLATSKIESYNRIGNKEFKDFNNTLKRRSLNSSVSAMRIYLLDEAINDEDKKSKIKEIVEAEDSGITTRYLILKSGSFSSAKDFALVFEPRTKNNLKTITKNLENHEQPAQYLIKTNSKRFGMLFDVKPPLEASNSVDEVELYDSTDPNLRTLIEDFDNLWSMAKPPHDPTPILRTAG